MPTELDDNQTDLQSSEQVNDVTEAQEAASGAAEPSTATDEPKDMLSVVRDVVEASEEPASSAEAAEDAGEEPADPEPVVEDDENFSDVPFNKHPRFQKLVKENRENRADAQRYRNVEGFLRENDLTADQAFEAMQVAALMRNNPQEFLVQIKPLVQKALIATGEVLPEDLRGQVQNGQMPVDAAREVSRARASLAQQQERERLNGERRQQAEVESQRMAVVNTVQSWVTDRAVKDPAFESKKPLLQREIAFLQRTEGVPNTPDGALAQVKRAYASVNQQARVPAPANPRPTVRPVTGGSAPGNQTAQPKTMLDALRAGLK